jgi:hypothetical protein
MGTMESVNNFTTDKVHLLMDNLIHEQRCNRKVRTLRKEVL